MIKYSYKFTIFAYYLIVRLSSYMFSIDWPSIKNAIDLTHFGGNKIPVNI